MEIIDEDNSGVGLEIVGMVGTRDASEIKGPLVDGPVVDWSDGPVVDPGYLTAIARAHEDAGFDRVLVGYGAVGPEAWSVASSVLHTTRRLKVLVAQRPGLISPPVMARTAATLDQLTGGGRVAMHIITGGDEADQRREGDFVAHDDRYRRSGEAMAVMRRIWCETEPFDHAGEHFRFEGAFSSVKPATPGGIPMYFAGASAPAIEVGAAHADVYAFWGEPLDAISERIAGVSRAAGRHHRHLRYSVSLRPILADTEAQAWEKAEWIAATTEARLIEARQRSEDPAFSGLGGRANQTFAVGGDGSITTSVGRKRLIAASAQAEVCDERLWMKVARLTGAAGNSTALVGTPDQVATSMLRYRERGVSTLLLKGFDPLLDAIDMGERLVPRLRTRAQLA